MDFGFDCFGVFGLHRNVGVAFVGCGRFESELLAGLRSLDFGDFARDDIKYAMGGSRSPFPDCVEGELCSGWRDAPGWGCGNEDPLTLVLSLEGRGSDG